MSYKFLSPQNNEELVYRLEREIGEPRREHQIAMSSIGADWTNRGMSGNTGRFTEMISKEFEFQRKIAITHVQALFYIIERDSIHLSDPDIQSITDGVMSGLKSRTDQFKDQVLRELDTRGLGNVSGQFGKSIDTQLELIHHDIATGEVQIRAIDLSQKRKSIVNPPAPDQELQELWNAFKVIGDGRLAVDSDQFKSAWSRMLKGRSAPKGSLQVNLIRSDADFARAWGETEKTLAVYKAVQQVRNADSRSVRSVARNAAEIIRKLLGEPPLAEPDTEQKLDKSLTATIFRNSGKELGATNTRPISIFYSYSRKDEDLRNELEAHLSTLRTNGLISEWHDRCIKPGDDWETKISENLERADLILLLVSSDFLASNYCRSKEMKRAMERHDAGQAHVIPVILRAVYWHEEIFSKLQALPTDANPITSWSNRDEAWRDVALGIRRAIDEIAKPSPVDTLRAV